MLSEMIAIAGLGLDVYKTLSGVSASRRGEVDIGRHLDALQATVQKLADGIYYAPGWRSVRDKSRALQQRVTDLRQVRQSLDPIHHSLGCDILSSDMIAVPEKTRLALAKNAWDVLDHIQPLGVARAPVDPNAVPLVFSHEGTHFVGWQKRGVLPMLLDISYDGAGAVDASLRDLELAATVPSQIPQPQATMVETGIGQFTLVFGSHQIAFWSSAWSTLQTVSYDGREVSRKRTFGSSITHMIQVTEDGRQTSFAIVGRLSVWIGRILKCEVLRNGIPIYRK
jgi:hypothetical protein